MTVALEVEMKQRILGAVVLLVIVLLLPDLAAGLEIGDAGSAQSACASDTLVYILPVRNTDGKADAFTVSLSGEAARWAVAAPAGFVLQPGEGKSVYIYITPSSKAQFGTYGLEVLVNSGLNGKASKSISVVVNDCHSASLAVEKAVAEGCACQPQDIKATLQNTGKYAENFEISLSGSGARYASATLGEVKLNPKETKDFAININTACSTVGQQDVVVSAVSKDSNAVASTQIRFNSQSCYGFDVAADKNYMSFCENSEVKIPIIVKNTGTVGNTFSLSLAGPAWARLEDAAASLQAGQQRSTNLVLFPGFGIKGDFTAIIKVVDEKGRKELTREITANVLQCHNTDVKLAAQEDTICPFTSKAYAISLANNGRYSENYALTTTGADFASLDKNFATLDKASTQKLNLIVSPKDAQPDVYLIRVDAESQGPSHTSSTDVLKLRVAPKEACFGVKTEAALTNVKVAYGEGALIPVVVENKGREAATFNLEVSGSGASFAQLNPATVMLKGAEAQTVYLYVAVPVDAQQKDYKITMGARLKDGTVSSSSTIDVFVVRQGEGMTAIAVPTNPIAANKANRTAVDFGGWTSTVRSLISKTYSNIKEKSSERGISLGLPQIPTQEQVKARAENDLIVFRMRFSGMIDLITGKAALALPKANVQTTPSLATDTLKKASAADSDLRARISTVFASAFGTTKPVSDKIKSYRSGAYELARGETFGYENWMIGGSALLVLIVLVGIGAALPKKEGKGLLKRAWDWLEEEEPEAAVPPQQAEQRPATPPVAVAEKPQKGIFGRFLDWLEEEDAEETKTEPAALPQQDVKSEEKPTEQKSAAEPTPKAAPEKKPAAKKRLARKKPVGPAPEETA